MTLFRDAAILFRISLGKRMVGGRVVKVLRTSTSR
jgi:hypothetical protein